MSVAPPAVEIKVAPSRRMSVSIRNVFQVLAWSLWSPYSLVDYGYGLLHRSTAEGRLPTRARDWPQWWNDNPHHRAWLILAGSVALLLFACLLLILLLMITPLMITPLVALSARQIGAEVIVYVLLWAFTWGPTLLLVRWTATRTGNVGYLLMAALPGGIGIALLWMVVWWGRYTPIYLSADPALRNAIFLIWGYGLGYFASLIHAIWPLEIADLKKLFGLYAVACLVILVVLLSASGLTWGTLTTIFTVHAAALHAAFWCCIGLLIGLLRPMEYLALVTHFQPNASRWGWARVWWMPGSTLLPLDPVQGALSRHLDSNWPYGLRVAARLSAVSSQQEPLVQAMRHHLTVCEAEQLPALLYNVGDSGAPCAGNTIKPPVVPGPTLRQRLARTAPPPPPPKPKSPQRLAFEMELADILRHPHQAPVFDAGARAQAIGAAFWYYLEGYLYEAVDVLPQISSANGTAPAPASQELEEMAALTASFAALMDLDVASSKSTVDLPLRPAVCRRRSTWSLIDHFVRAARWAWRARQSQEPVRARCWRTFGSELKTIEHQAQDEELTERKLAWGLAIHWRGQIRSLLAIATPVPGFVRVKVRRWNSVYPQLAASYPWRSAGDELHEAWRPGRTTVTWVSSQPLAKPGAAIRMAANNNTRRTVRILCNLEAYRTATQRVNLWRMIYTEMANRLKEPPGDPTGRSADTLIEWMARLCSKHHQHCIVLVIQNADLLNKVFPFTSGADHLVELLCRMEREIPNFALTLESSAALDERQQWEHRMGSVALEDIYLPLLTLAGVGGWLKRQFDPAGVFVDAQAVAAIYWHTGGHPYLLEHLARCIADAYNENSPVAPPSPVITIRKVDEATGSTWYSSRRRSYGEALGRVLRRHEDEDVRFVLDLLAERKPFPEKPVSADELAQIADEQFRPIALPEIQKMLERWEALEVVERREQGGVNFYLLRSYSFAQWLTFKALAP